ncbi:hypothetical protein SUGI_1427910 [Cryptomeria japonica]|uniref:Uncharacterized protein n=1 Tax=Cryptomeria japonica TaxID=3369 RepID=A0AAD3NUJ3_CRYJA|nr:hypothetical protein SUGI_1427910 [Cryptomeria japonica]
MTSPCVPARLASSSWWRAASNFASSGNENRLPSTAWLKVFRCSRPFAEERMGGFRLLGSPLFDNIYCRESNKCFEGFPARPGSPLTWYRPATNDTTEVRALVAEHNQS